MTISVGDKLPDVTLVKATAEGPQQVQASEYFSGKKVALFSVPGAFTPTCSAKHLPGFVEKAEDLKAKGVDEIVGTAVNDKSVGSHARAITKLNFHGTRTTRNAVFTGNDEDIVIFQDHIRPLCTRNFCAFFQAQALKGHKNTATLTTAPRAFNDKGNSLVCQVLASRF